MKLLMIIFNLIVLLFATSLPQQNQISKLAEQFSEQINSSQDYNATPYISPDGSYLMFSRESHKSHRMQIFISFRKPNGEWTEAKNIVEYIGDKGQNCPIITPGGKYLFFLRYVHSFCQPFWVDAKFIEELESKKII